MDRRHWIPLCCILLLALAGCAGFLGGSGDDDVDPTSVTERVDDRLESIDTLRFTMTQTVEMPNRTVSFEMRVVYQRPGRYNITYLDGPVPFAYAASNGSATWRYNRSDDEFAVDDAVRFESPSDLLLGADQLDENATFEGNETLAGEDATELSFAVSDSEVSLLLGGGQQTSQMGRASGNGSVRSRVWIDTDLWLPRKAQLNVTAFNRSQTVTVEYDDVEINPELADSQFTFDPPADAEVVRGDQSSFRPPRENATRYVDRTVMAAEAPFPLPEPSLPAGYAFEEGAVVDDPHGVGVELVYTDGESSLELVAFRDHHRFLDRGETVPVGDTTGLLVEVTGDWFLQWECDDRLYLIASDDSRETALSVADSIGCS
jgi:outer membrane lipoprotein-sorting protein